LEDAWAAVSEAKENILAIECGLMAKFGQFLESEFDEAPPAELRTSRGKATDPHNWGDLNLNKDEIDPETQQALLNKAANTHSNEYVPGINELQAKHLRLEAVQHRT